MVRLTVASRGDVLIMMNNAIRNYITPIVIVLAAVWIAGCDPKETPQNFPHGPHIEQEIECDACHSIEPEGITMPSVETCTMCHDIEEDEAYNRCKECHDAVGFKLTNDKLDLLVSHQDEFDSRIPDSIKELQYKHAEFWQDSSECLLCHGNLTNAKGSTVDNIPSMEVAMAVHEEKGFSNDCQVCHSEINEWTAPSNHDSSWDRIHGQVAIIQGKQDCLMCHQESTCQTCHSIEKPRNHTSLFRHKTHGVLASFDRSKCLACHRNDQCTVCHQASADPIPAASYHTPDASCLTCHSPMASQGPAPRPPQRFFKPMPHRMMMGLTASKCLECHMF